jgi:zinc protease
VTQARSIRIPGTNYPVERFTLDNGLRVVLAPDRSAPVVGVAVLYDVGIRSEPPGRTGFAHLFEHLMFQGSANLNKLDHFRYVQGSGGTFNGSTHLDYTDYYETLPSAALERTLFLEADRMAGPTLTEANLRNQVDVVKEEIRVNIQNRPYGGFPWLKLPPVMFDTFPNAHDGYGSFDDLDAATVDEAAEFFDTYYATGNAVLAVAGDLEPDRARAMIDKHFGNVPARPAPPRADLAEPDLTAERRESYVDPLAPAPAVAAAWRVPDPVSERAAYLPYVLLAEVLTDGESSRLVERLTLRDRTATSVIGYLGFMGEPFAVRDPTALVLSARLPAGGVVDTVLTAIDEELDRLATDGLTPGELERTQARTAAQLLHSYDAVNGRCLSIAGLELVHAAPAVVNELPRLLGEVTAAQLREAAAALRADRRASIELVPGGGS